MKHLFIAAALCGLSAPVLAGGMSGNSLLAECGADSAHTSSATRCEAYVIGIWHGLGMGAFSAVTKLGSPDLSIPDQITLSRITTEVCQPDAVTDEQVYGIVEKYIVDHPESRHLSVSILALAALQDAFPCPGGA